MSNGVEVIVADANADEESNASGTKSKLLRDLSSKTLTLLPSTLSNNVRMTISLEDKITSNSNEYQKLLSSSMSTSTEKRSSPQTAISHHGLQLRHNYIVKTCFTTFTYLTTLVQKSRTVVSTYETVVSTVTTEPFQISPTITNGVDLTNDKMFQSTINTYNGNIILQKYNEDNNNLERESVKDDDIIQPSEVSPTSSSCTLSSCPCTVTLTESLNNHLKTKITNEIDSTDISPLQLKRSPPKSTQFDSTIMDIESTSIKEIDNKFKTKIHGHNKDENSLLKSNSSNSNQNKLDRPTKTKFQVVDLLKLGTLGIKKLAPMIEQMTDNLKRRQEINKHVSTSTIRPVTKITPYIVNKRVDTIEAESKSPGNFPIYIPVDDMDISASESQNVYANSTLHRNIVWASQNLKTSRTNLASSKPVHESPLVNGGIPISPGEIITANSDVIIGKPAVGGPNIHINSPASSPVDSHVQSSNLQDVRVKAPQRGQGLKHIPFIRDDDTYDLRPPMVHPPNPLPPPLNNIKIQDQHSMLTGAHHRPNPSNEPNNLPPKNYQIEIVKSESVPYKGGNVITIQTPNNKPIDQIGIQPPLTMIENHGRPALLDYIPSLDVPASYQNYLKTISINRKNHELNQQNKHLQGNDNRETNIESSRKPSSDDSEKANSNKQFLVDIQPSRVANVIIPHGSTTALVFAGSSEPHKNGQYVDGPSPYLEHGHFGSFSIDSPQSSVAQGGPKQSQQNVNEQRIPTKENLNAPLKHKPNLAIVNHGVSGFNQDGKPLPKWKFDQRHPHATHGNLPPPSSDQKTTIHFGPHVVMKHEQHIRNHEIPPPTLSPEMFYYGNTIKSTTLGYENELAVPPPPPPHIQVKYESNIGVVNSDFNQFKNGQQAPQPHLPKRPGLYDHQKLASNEIYAPQHTNNRAPPKITSEVYYASTGNHQQNKPASTNIMTDFGNSNNNNMANSFNVGTITLNTNPTSNSQLPAQIGNRYNIPQEGGLITLNAGTSVQGNSFPEQTIPGSETSVSSINDSTQTFNTHSVKNINKYDGESTGISIGTNFAISVAPSDNGALQKPQNEAPQVIIGESGWTSPIDQINDDDYIDINTGGVPDNILNGNQKVHIVHASSYSDFNQYNSTSNSLPVGTKLINTKDISRHPNNTNQRPSIIDNKINLSTMNRQTPILIPQNQNKQKSTQPKIVSTTPKIIPLTFNFDNNAATNENFGQRIPALGIPQMNYNWEVPDDKNNLPEYMSPPPLTTQAFNNENYYKQTVPTKPLYATNAINNIDLYHDKYPQNTQTHTSSTHNHAYNVIFKPLRNITQKDEILLGSENEYVHDKPDFNANHNIGSQTETPFNEAKYKVVPLVTLPGVRPTSQTLFNRPITQMSPRPFSITENKPSISGLPSDIPQPRPFQKPQKGQSINNTLSKKETEKIITSSIHLSTNKPIKIVNISLDRVPSTLPTPINNTIDITDDLSPPPLPTIEYNVETIMGMSPPPKIPSTKIPNGEVSTYKPSHNVIKNQYKRPGDYFRITTRPFSRYATASTIIRPKVASTITRIVYPSRSSISSWKNPTRIETNIKQTLSNISPSIINTTPMGTVGMDIMHPEVYPEETLGVVVTSIPSKSAIFPSKVQPSGIFATVITNIDSGITTPSIISAPSVVHHPSAIQSSFGENIFKSTNVFKPTETLKSTFVTVQSESSKSIEKSLITLVNPSLETAANDISDVSVIPLNHDNSRRKSEQITIITHTTTLSEPPSTIMTTRFVTLTHTLTVTQTKTSIVSPLVGSTTQTLTLTNTHTSTVVDVVTEVHTLVHPTTIVQTVTKHVPLETLPAWETKYPKVPIEPTTVKHHQQKTSIIDHLDDVSLSSDEDDFIIHPDNSTDIHFQNKETEQGDNDNFFVVMNKSQNGGSTKNVNQESQDFDGAIRNEEASNDGVSRVLLGEILLAGTPYLESPHPIVPTGTAYGKECQPDCKASRNERCQRVHGMMKCVCRPGFARIFPDRPCKPTYTYSMKLALSRYGNERLLYQESLSDQNSPDFQALAIAAHDGVDRMVKQSDLRDVYHGVHVNGFHPVDIPASKDVEGYKGVINDFYVQLSDNAHEDRLKDVMEKYLRSNNYSLGGTNVFAASELVDKLEVGDFNECISPQFHDCSEYAECFNLRATYTCSCKEGYADLSVNPLYPGRICSADSIGCEKCHYHGTCYNKDDSEVLCECFQWYAGESCQVNLKVILISLATLGAILLLMLIICMAMTCARKGKNSRPSSQARPANIMASCLTPIHQSAIPSSKMHPPLDKRALIQERGNDSGGEGSSIQNMSIPYAPPKKMSQVSQKSGKKPSMTMDDSEKEKKPFTLMIPRAKYCPAPVASPLNPEHRDSNAGLKRKASNSETAESKLLSYLDAGPSGNDDFGKRKQSNESSYSNRGAHQKYSAGALVSAGFKVSTTVIRSADGDSCTKDLQDDMSSITKSNTYGVMDMQSQFNSLRKAYSQEDINDWTDAERRIGELTMSEARSFDGTLVKPSTKILHSTAGSNKSSHYTQHEANTMAERDLGSTFLLPHVHLYKPDLGSDGSEFDSI